MEEAKNSMEREIEGAKFRPPPYLYPISKPQAPFRIWCIDTVTNLTPAAPNGATDFLIAVCAYSKWVEVGAIPTLNSHETVRWFHEEVVCRYGVPLAVRTDRGLEYQGEFARYLGLNGISH